MCFAQGAHDMAKFLEGRKEDSKTIIKLTFALTFNYMTIVEIFVSIFEGHPLENNVCNIFGNFNSHSSTPETARCNY